MECASHLCFKETFIHLSGHNIQAIFARSVLAQESAETSFSCRVRQKPGKRTSSPAGGALLIQFALWAPNMNEKDAVLEAGKTHRQPKIQASRTRGASCHQRSQSGPSEVATARIEQYTWRKSVSNQTGSPINLLSLRLFDAPSHSSHNYSDVSSSISLKTL